MKAAEKWKTTDNEPNRTSEESNRWRSLRFALVWIAVFIVVKGVLAPLARQYLGSWVCLTETQHASFLARLLGFSIQTSENYIGVSDFWVYVAFPCTGVDYMLYLFGLTLSFPLNIRRRLLWCLLLPLIVYGFVILRIVGMLAIGPKWPGSILSLHEIFNAALALFACVVWGAFLVGQLRPISLDDLLSLPRENTWKLTPLFHRMKAFFRAYSRATHFASISILLFFCFFLLKRWIPANVLPPGITYFFAMLIFLVAAPFRHRLALTLRIVAFFLLVWTAPYAIAATTLQSHGWLLTMQVLSFSLWSEWLYSTQGWSRHSHSVWSVSALLELLIVP